MSLKNDVSTAAPPELRDCAPAGSADIKTEIGIKRMAKMHVNKFFIGRIPYSIY
jgi:hypothetical protein